MSQSRASIALGRTGQVVERGGTLSNFRELHNDTGPRTGNKRSIGDTLGRYPDGLIVASKRQRDVTTWGPCGNGSDEMGLTPNDLRLKLMRRRSKQCCCGLEEHKRRDLHEKLPKSAQPSTSNNRLQLRPPQAKGSFLLRQSSLIHNADHVHEVDSVRKLQSSWIVNGLGTRSPDNLLKTTMAITPPRNYDDLEYFPSIMATNVSTAKPFLGNGVFDASRPTGLTCNAIESTTKIAKPVIQLAPRSGIVEKTSQLGEEPLTVSGLLHSLGLEKYEITFRAEEVDLTVLKQMGENDFKELGIPMGPRKKILLALSPRMKQ